LDSHVVESTHCDHEPPSAFEFWEASLA
jgi:hypothetical protein